MTTAVRRPRPSSHRIDPAIPMLVFCVAVAVSPEFEFMGIPKVRVSDLLLPLLLLFFIGAAATQPEKARRRPRPIPLLAPMALVILWDLAAWALFSEEGPKLSGLMYLGKRAEFFVVYLLGVNVVQSHWGWERLMRLFVVAAPILNVSVLWDLASHAEHYRASGIIRGQETSTAMFIVVVLGLVVGAWPVIRQPLERFSLLLAAATGAAALLATGSRAGLICAGIVVATPIWRDRQRRFGLVVAMVCVTSTAWLFMPEQLQERIEGVPGELTSTWRGLVDNPELMPTAGSSSVAARVLVAQHVLAEVIPRGPITGLGTARMQLGLVDDFWLTEWVYHGLVGVALFAFLLWQMHKVLARARDETDDPLERGVANGMHAVLLALLASTLVAETFYLIRPMEAFMLLVGMVVGRTRLQEDRR